MGELSVRTVGQRLGGGYRETMVMLLRGCEGRLGTRINRLEDNSTGKIGEGDFDSGGVVRSAERWDWSVGGEVETKRAEG